MRCAVLPIFTAHPHLRLDPNSLTQVYFCAVRATLLEMQAFLIAN